MTPTLMEPKVTVSAQVSASTRERLLDLAAKGDRSLSAEVRRAVAEHLERTQQETA